MEYTQKFKDFVNAYICPDGQDSYAGIGNPNAKILIIGKEAAMGEADEKYKSNAFEWNENIKNSRHNIKQFTL